MGTGNLARTVSLGVVLFGFWLLLSGHFHDPLLLGLGAASCVLVLIIAHRMDVIDHESHPHHLGWRVIVYFPWLVWEITKANIAVAKIILDPKLPISPVLFWLRGSQKTEVGRVVYANSITLTPGTVTVDMVGDRLEIHALTREAAEDLMSGAMDRRVTRVEGEMEAEE